MVILVVLIMMMLMTEISIAFFIKKNFRIKSTIMAVMLLTWKRTAQTSQ